MFPSNLKALFLILPLLVLGACTKAAKGPADPGSGSTFIVKSLTGTGSQAAIPDQAVWKVPNAVRWEFYGCLVDLTTRVELREQDIFIELPGGKQIPSHTNNVGCFNWDETIDYNHYSGRSGWVIEPRTIVGAGVNVGRVQVSLGLNPWAVGDHKRDTEPEVRFLNPGFDVLPVNVYEAGIADAAMMGQIQGEAKLDIRGVKVRAIPIGETNTSIVLAIHVEMQPYVKSMNASNITVYTPVTDGDFNLLTQVLASEVGANLDSKVLLFKTDQQVMGHSRNGVLTFDFKVTQNVRATQGNLQLALHVEPLGLNAYKSLKPANGLYPFGAGTVVRDQDGGIASVCDDSDSACAYDKLIQSASNYAELLKEGYILPNSRYIFSSLKLRFNVVLSGETATQRTVGYSASTCITDFQTGRPLANEPMVINYLPDDSPDPLSPNVERKREEKSTDESGCLNWNGQVFHKYYRPEQFFERNIVITKGEHTLKGSRGTHKFPNFSRKLKFYLNPWDDKFTFGWDERELTPDFFKQVLEKPKIPSRFYVSDYNFHTVRFLYNIDKSMELEVRKWISIGVTPKVLRYSGIVNARKMVEPLRDGIYLMKVAIQKNYLDPRDNEDYLLHEVIDPDSKELKAELVQLGDQKNPMRGKNFVTTNGVLVRVVDGHIVYPIELVMRDLRLMRVRANFMIQLEMVDERLVQAYTVFRKQAIKDADLETKLAQFNEILAKTPETSLVDANTILGTQDLQADLADLKAKREHSNLVEVAADQLNGDPTADQARIDLEQAVLDAGNEISRAVSRLGQLYDKGLALGHYVEIDDDGKPQATADKVTINRHELINDNFEAEKGLFDELEAAIGYNDFSTVSLPQKEDIALDSFVEHDPNGLLKRTFVGPVIFLSNSYSDATRATDNLDEAKCDSQTKTGEDALARAMDAILQVYSTTQSDFSNDANADLFMHRQNNAYQYSSYFSSLNNLCYKSVDDMHDDELKLAQLAKDQETATALPYNYAALFNLDYVSLTDVPLQKLKPGCFDHLENCLVNTNERTVKAGKLGEWINSDLEYQLNFAVENADTITRRLSGVNPWRPEKTSWKPEEYKDLFYPHADGKDNFKRNPDTNAALCNMLAHRIADELHAKNLTSLGNEVIYEHINSTCNLNDGLIHDVKLRVLDTGRYTFLGGLNLNFNVAEGFSVSSSTNWNYGVEFTDIIGVAGAGAMAFNPAIGAPILAAATILKPLGVKQGGSLSASNGTSVQASTYLVSQIAGFDVRLKSYERCAIVRLSDATIHRLANNWGDNNISRVLTLFHTIDFENPDALTTFQRGLFVCEGGSYKSNAPRSVQESYFYFTQHFTEGDMLDQGELYNQPWLIALRGMRDFGTFVNKIQGQEIVNFGNFIQSASTDPRPLMNGWPLKQLDGAYKSTGPTLPGFYTMLEEGEINLDFFSLNKKEDDPLHTVLTVPDSTTHVLSKRFSDPNREIIHPEISNEFWKSNMEKPVKSGNTDDPKSGYTPPAIFY